MSLPNSPISGFPLYSSIKPGFWLAMDDMDRVETVRLDIKELLASPISQDFEWVTDNDPGYALNEVVTYGGKWWQSQVNDNLNITPGTDPTKWLEVNKSAAGFVPWQAGVFPQDLPFVYVNEGDLDNPEIHMYVLASPVRPYVSSDIAAEILAGDWVEVFKGGTEHFKGVFVSLVALQTAFPTSEIGSYAFVDSPGNNAVMYIWDNDDSIWVQSGGTFGDVTGPPSSTALSIAVFDDNTGKVIADGGQTLSDIQSNIDAGDNFIQGYAEQLAAKNPRKPAVTAATTGVLPAYHFVAGTRSEIVADVNGPLPNQDGVSIADIVRLLIKDEVGGNAKYNGVWEKIQPGVVGVSPWVFVRSLDTEPPAGVNGSESDLALVQVELGTVNAGKTFQQITIPMTLNITSQTWVDVTSRDHFKGVFPSLVALQTAYPVGQSGDYAYVNNPGSDAIMYIWDNDDSAWVSSGAAPILPLASETVAGIVEEATDAEMQAGTAVGGTGAKLFSQPAKLATWWAWLKTQTQAFTGRLSGKHLFASWTALTDAATIAWDADAQGNFASVTITANRTLGAIANPQAGGLYIIRVIQDATGGRTLAFNAIYTFSGGVTPILNSLANQSTVFVFFFDGTSMRYCGASGDYKLANLYLSAQAAAGSEQRPLFIDVNGKIQKSAFTNFDETNKKVNITGGTTTHIAVFEILNSALDMVMTAYNDQQVAFGGATMVISVLDAIVSGSAYIEINSNQLDAFKVIDKANNIYIRMISSTGALALEIKQRIKYDTGQGYEEWKVQALVRTTGVAAAVNLIANVPIPTDYAISVNVTNMFAYATDGSGVIASGGREALVRNVAGTVSGAFGTFATQADPANTATWSMVADNTNKRININFINTTVTGKTYDVSLSFNYVLRQLPV